MVQVYPDNSIKGYNLHQSVMIIDFINENDDRDSAAFKIPYPPQWIHAIENNLLKENTEIINK
ncbi:MAG: hypothetical protein JRE14_11465 [Deltaproteobacteria bacterium]|nr:hypothetical protein [Deltaproteobacteria bacterium]